MSEDDGVIEYLFVWDRLENKWPLRYVVSRGGLVSIPSHVPFDGVLSADESEALLEHLRMRYPEPRFVVARMSATSWEAVEEDFPGLYMH